MANHSLMSPDTDTFSTPPTTPGIHDAFIRPSISRRSSRPSTLQLENEWKPDIEVDESLSPDAARKMNGNLSPAGLSRDQTVITPRSSVSQNQTLEAPRVNHYQRPMDSPCFVHSNLDKGASLTDWLRNKQNGIGGGDVGVAKSLQSPHPHHHEYHHEPAYSPTSSVLESNDEDEGSGGNLTKQLAETAVSVREMSKQLGRARVRSNIQTVLIVTKARDNRLIKLTRELAVYLMLKKRVGQRRGLVVYVDNQLRKSRRFDAEGIERDHPELFVPFPHRRTSSSNSISSMTSTSAHKEDFYSSKDQGQLRYWTSSMCSHSPHLFDFVVTLGGDGTVLFTSWLFQRIVPPVLSFALGSLGFLTNFDFEDHKAVMDSVVDSGIRVNLRMRFTCTVFRAVANEKGKGRTAVKKGETGEIMMRDVGKGGWEALEGGWSGGPEAGKPGKDKEIMCFTTRPVETFEVLNDLVVDRGPSPYVSLLELFGDEHHMTTVQADGLTVSTPTGSTAYSLSAGGSLVHPEIPALLITPICPHTLSFRPMLLPDSMELRICVPFNSRSTAWASFDGRGRVELKQGDHIRVTASRYPFPTVCADKQSTDWFHAISRTLKWNERERQKSFVVVEEGPAKAQKKKHNHEHHTPHLSQAKVVHEEEDEEEANDSDDEGEDEGFDIDDSSPEAASADTTIEEFSHSANGASGESVGQEKAQEVIADQQIHKLLAPSAFKHLSRKSKSKSRSRSRSGARSGVDTPDRYAGPHPHPLDVSPRHINFDIRSEPPSPTGSTASSSGSGPVDFNKNGARDDIHSPRRPSGKSRIPVNRDVDMDSIKTPTVANLPYPRRGHSRSRSDEHGPRAFAVWGHDESDSNASDSDA